MKEDKIKIFGLKESGLTAKMGDLFLFHRVDCESSELVSQFLMPRRIEGSTICICERGHCEFMIDSKVYTIQENDMLIIFSQSVFQNKSHSPDVILYTLGVNSEFISSMNIAAAVPLYLFIKEHPCISLNDEDRQVVVELCELLRRKSNQERNPYMREISESILLAIFYEISSIYLRRKPIEQRVRKRNEELFASFLDLVNNNFKEQRSIEFYASKLCITPKHLSLVVRRSSGYSAGHWISSAVIIHARILLKSTNMTVTQVSDYLNFPNLSFFCQYFKKRTGFTPKEIQNK